MRLATLATIRTAARDGPHEPLHPAWTAMRTAGHAAADIACSSLRLADILHLNNSANTPSAIPPQHAEMRQAFSMYAISATRQVNPPDVLPLLTPEQVWRGLVMKAENALPFVKGMQQCRVLERYDDGFLREIVLRGVRMTERITFTPPVQVFFRRVESQGHDGWIANLISESACGPMLTFTFAVSFPGVAPGSVDEKRRGEEMKASYLGAVDSTLATVRRLVASDGL